MLAVERSIILFFPVCYGLPVPVNLIRDLIKTIVGIRQTEANVT